MKNKHIILLLLELLIFFFILSCGGSPPPVVIPDEPAKETTATPDPNQQAPGKDVLDALQAAMDRAEKSRNGAIEVQGSSYFPDDWKAAEDKHQAGKDAKKDTVAQVKEAIASFTAAADAYDDIAGKSRPLFAKDQEDAQNSLQAAMARAEKSRNGALEAQGSSYFPDDWKAAEDKHQAGKDAKRETLDEIKAATGLYTAAADAYDDIAGKSRTAMSNDQEAALNALNAAMARAEKSRNQALDAQSPTYFPNDWKTAESKNQTAKSAKKSTPAEMKAATGLYTAAADAYDDITGKSRAATAKDQADALNALNAAMARMEKSRQQALDAQGPTYFPNDWKTAESKNQTAKNAKKSTPAEMKAATSLYTAAADAYDDIASKSRAATAKDQTDAQNALNAAMARMEKSRQQALDNQASTYFPNDWKTAESKNQTAKSAKKSTPAEMKAATSLYTAAADAYDDIASKSRAAMTKDQTDAQNALNAAMARMEKSRQQALDNQAPTYFPNDWKGAEAKNQTAKNAKKGTPAEIKTAVDLYTAAADAYDDIADKSRVAMANDQEAALNALNAAMARAEKSRNEALDAQGPTYFPNDWKTAESKNQTAKNAKKGTPAEMKTAVALYTAAADAYDDIAGKSRTALTKDQEDTLNALNAAMARVEKSRQQALDKQAPTYFPNDWKGAESKNQTAKNAKRSTPAEMKAAIALYIAAADAYDDIAGKSQAAMGKDQEDAQNALNAAMARAEKSRQQALDNQAPTYFPNDWKTAESKNQTAKSAKKSTPAEMKAATALYIAAADAYDDIAGKSQTAMAKDQEDTQNALNAAMARMEKSRQQALDNQAPTYFPNDWKGAEAKNQTAKSAKKSTPAEMKAAVALYTAAADAYDDIAGKSQAAMLKEQADAQNALNAAMARAEKSRQQALDNQAPTYFPNDWKGAETKNQTAKSAKKSTPADIKAATALYTAAADAYDDIAGKSRAAQAKDQADAQNTLKAAIARVEKSRNQALSFQGSSYFPKDWDLAESKNQAGKNTKQDTLDNMKAAIALYTTAADTYDAITRKSRPLFTKDWEDAITKERTAAVQAGINDIAPNHLISADKVAAETRSQFESPDYAPTSDTTELPLDMYRALKIRADASRVRQEITERGFDAYDPDNNLKAGDGILLAAVKDYEGGKPKIAQNEANEALMRYNKVFKNGWMAFAQDRRLEASKQRQIALDLKADVAVRNDFNGADGIYQQGEANFQTEAFEQAANFYTQSASLFVAAGKAAEEKYRRAEKAVASAEQKTADSEAHARSVGQLMIEGDEQ